MNCIVRNGRPGDIAQVLELIKELAYYEKAPKEVIVTELSMLKDAFGEKPVFEFLVAEVDEKVVGTAVYYLKYSTWKGTCLFLEDLIVTESMRGKQIGAELFKALVQISKTKQYQRMEWQVLDWNEPAINFYKKFNANFDPTWVNCKLTYEQLQQVELKQILQ